MLLMIRTRRPYRYLAAVAFAATAIGCGDKGDDDDGGGDANEMDCAWIEGDDNCWATVAASTVGCVHADGALGTFDADRSTCTYEDGASVEFVEPLPAELDAGLGDDLDVVLWDSAGGECASFTQTADSFHLTGPAGTVVADYLQASAVYTCPDGSQWTMSSHDLLECELSRLPGYGMNSSSSDITVTLTTTETALFSCEDPS